MVYIKGRETRPGWMDECCHGDDRLTLTINRHIPQYIYCSVDCVVCCDNIGMCLLIVRVKT